MNLQEIVTRVKEKLLSLGVKQWAMLLLAGVCCLVIVFPTGKAEKKTPPGNTNTESGAEAWYGESENKEPETYTEQMEARLTELLSCVKHVGKVKVMITVSNSGQKNVLQDGSRETEQVTEIDSAGGNRHSVSEKKEGTTVFYDIAGESVPYILSETYPEVTGVVVLAEGSGTGSVDLDILNAVQVLFDVPAHKIKIMKMK